MPTFLPVYMHDITYIIQIVLKTICCHIVLNVCPLTAHYCTLQHCLPPTESHATLDCCCAYAALWAPHLAAPSAPV
jgi:hypothetical protein